MSNVLVIKAHPLTGEESSSMKLMEQFIQTYSEKHGQESVEVLDLYNSYIPEVDETLLTAWNSLKAGAEFTSLSPEQQTAVSRFNELTEQFLAADKIVIANALWNLNVPTRLKAWIDTVNVSGKTFKYTATGPVPLTEGKKVLHIQSNGGSYDGQDFSSQFVKGILNFVGVEDFHQLFVEGVDHYPERRDEILGTALAKASAFATDF